MADIIIKHFGTLSEKQASEFIQQILEYTSLQDLLHKTVQEAYSEHIHGSLCFPPQKIVSQDTNEIYNFFKEHIDNSCLIIQDLILKRCRSVADIAEIQRNAK